MFAEIIISTACLVANGVPPEVVKSSQVFEVPAVCLVEHVRKLRKGCTVYSDGLFECPSWWRRWGVPGREYGMLLKTPPAEVFNVKNIF